MWFWFAIGASVLWGIGYVTNQYLLRFLTPAELIFFESVLVVATFLPWFYFHGGVKEVFFKLHNPKLALILLASTAIYITAALCIFKSISASNASIAAIIEACYPLFTMLFAYIILGEVQFTLTSLIGCGFILAGLAIINLG